MPDEFISLLAEVSGYSRKIQGSFRLRLKYHGRNFYNKKYFNYYELRHFLYALKDCDNTLQKLCMIDSKSHAPLKKSIFGDFQIVKRVYKRYSLWNKTTGERIMYNDVIVPEFKRMNAAIAFKTVLLGNSEDVEIKVRKFESAKDKEDILLLSAKQAARRIGYE